MVSSLACHAAEPLGAGSSSYHSYKLASDHEFLPRSTYPIVFFLATHFITVSPPSSPSIAVSPVLVQTKAEAENRVTSSH